MELMLDLPKDLENTYKAYCHEFEQCRDDEQETQQLIKKRQALLDILESCFLQALLQACVDYDFSAECIAYCEDVNNQLAEYRSPYIFSTAHLLYPKTQCQLEQYHAVSQTNIENILGLLGDTKAALTMIAKLGQKLGDLTALLHLTQQAHVKRCQLV